MENKGEIIIYKTEGEQIQIDVRLEEDTVWLTQEQMSLLFQKDRTVVTRHINNIFKEGELKEKSNVQKMHFPYSDKPTKLYNLDVIISVGYRVKSKRGTQFRIWANKVLKEYLLLGYSLNERLLNRQNEKLILLNNAIKLISSISGSEYLNPENQDSFILVLERYSTALNVLDDYDYNRFVEIKGGIENVHVLSYKEVRKIIVQMKKAISGTHFFGKEKDDSLKSSISAIYQTFDGKDLYPTTEEKAANLLYFIVKNHSFVDGNKRIAAGIFLYFLDKNKLLNKIDLGNNFLVALTLMIANSKTPDKNLIVNIVSVLLQEKS